MSIMKRKKKLLYVGNQLLSHGLSPTSADTLPQALEGEGFEVVVVSNKRNKISRLWDMLLTTYKQRNHIDIVIIDTYSSWGFYYAVAVSKLCRWYRISYIPVLHGGNLPERLKKSPTLSQKFFQGAATNVSPSGYLLEVFQQAGYTKLAYIPNAIVLENYGFKLREKPSYRLLWVRSFAKIYNSMLALEVVKRLMEEGKTVSLCMVGPDKDGSLEACRKMAANQNLPVIFTGILKKEEWIAMSEEYDIFINTTHFDNMPVSVMEAMALGMPVISTNVGGMPYLIKNGETGVLVATKSPEAFVEAIRNLLENEAETFKMSHTARLEIEKLDWQNLKKQWLELLG